MTKLQLTIIGKKYSKINFYMLTDKLSKINKK